MIEVSDEEGLQSLLKNKKGVLVLFYASWCPYCRSFRSTFEKWVAIKGFNHAIRVNMNDYENPLWVKYSIDAVPTVIFFDCGKAIHRLDGQLGRGLNEMQFMQFLDRVCY
jgi:thioredoxin-like negative regulator of GroEL